MSRVITPLNAEREFGIDELFFSTTDKRGVITAGNAVFTRVSGYTTKELYGRPHNIIRHPDMPRAVFQLLWNYIQNGNPIAAYVKNLAKDGKYYWVTAFVIPIEEGYLSIRLKPSSPIFAEIPDIYTQMLQCEQGSGTAYEGRKAGVEAATARLGEILATKKFDNYDAFMHTFLVEEMKCRDQALHNHTAIAKISGGVSSIDTTSEPIQRLQYAVQLGSGIQEHFVQVFQGLEDYLLLYERLTGKSQFIWNLSQSIGRLSLNATIESARLRAEGACLSVVADWMRGNSREISEAITDLNQQMNTVTSSLKKTAFDIAASRLNIEMMAFFLAELLTFEAHTTHTTMDHSDTRVHLHRLGEAFSASVRGTKTIMASLNLGLFHLAQQLDQVLILIRTLGFAHVIGKVESARLHNPSVFRAIFDEVFNFIQDARNQLEDLMRTIASIEMQPIRTAEIEAFLTALK